MNRFDGPAVPVKRAAELLFCSERRVFQLLASRDLDRAQSAGKLTLVVTESITAYLLRQTDPAPVPTRRKRIRRADRAAEVRAIFSRPGRPGATG